MGKVVRFNNCNLKVLNVAGLAVFIYNLLLFKIIASQKCKPINNLIKLTYLFVFVDKIIYKFINNF
jgi:hypothetical protein